MYMLVCVCLQAGGGLSGACDGIHQVLHIDCGAIM